MIKDMMPFYYPSDKIVVKSKDCYQYDSNGKKYIDFEAGVWCTNIGHSNDQLVKLINSQVNESIHQGYSFRNEPAERLSSELQRLAGLKDGASAFLNTGSEAVNLSITLARHLTGRKKILKIHNSYLSAYGFARLSEDNDTVVTVKYNDCDAINNIDFSEISAFVVETGGASIEVVRFPDYDFVKKVIDEAKKNGCLIIAEEITTGFGRMGKWFGFQHYGFIPDMVVTGKALGNGYPVSAVTAGADVRQRFTENPFRYVQSHFNDPLGCAIGLEVIKIIEEGNWIEKGKEAGEYFCSQLEKLKGVHADKVKEVRARGLMLALEFYNDVDGGAINDKLFESGFVVEQKLNTLRFLPSLTIKKSDIDELIDCLEKLLNE